MTAYLNPIATIIVIFIGTTPVEEAQGAVHHLHPIIIVIVVIVFVTINTFITIIAVI